MLHDVNNSCFLKACYTIRSIEKMHCNFHEKTSKTELKQHILYMTSGFIKPGNQFTSLTGKAELKAICP